MSDEPHWERGHRVHGYWLHDILVGRVGLMPRGSKPMEYSWSVELVKGRIEGSERTLREAKEQVEFHFQYHNP